MALAHRLAWPGTHAFDRSTQCIIYIYVLDTVLCTHGDTGTSEARSEKAMQLPLCCWGRGLAGLLSSRDHHAGAQLSPPFSASPVGHWTCEK